MNLTSFTIKNNVVTFVLIGVLALLGFQAFNTLSRDAMPPFTVRFVTIVTNYPGGSPDRVELLVTDKIEKQLQQIAELDNIKSESRTNVSIVTLEIKSEYSEMQPIYDKIRRKVDEVVPDLPDGCSVQVKDEDVVDVYGIIYSITGDGYTDAELFDIAKDIKDGLIKLPNAAKVQIIGEQEERVYIDYDNAKFSELGLSQGMIKDALSKTNIIFPGGSVKIGQERIILEPTGNFESVDELKQTIIATGSNGEILRLGDVAKVYRGYKYPKESIVRVNGVQGIAIGIMLKEGGNIVELGEEVGKEIRHYESVYPWGIEFTHTAAQDEYVDKSVKDFVSNLLQSVATVLIVMFLFLGVRTGIVVSALIPSVIVITFLIMANMNIGLNQVSLAALIMALGMMVDNAIVMAESIMVKMERGQKVVEACIASSKELTIPLLISSLTTSAAFISFYLAQSTMGEIVGQIFVVITIALLTSWVLSLTFIPLMAVYLIKVQKVDPEKAKKVSFMDKFLDKYEAFLVLNLRRPWLLIGVIVVLFISSIYMLRFLPNIFMPDSDRPLVTVNYELPLSTDIDETVRIVQECEAFIQDSLMKSDESGIVNFTSFIGEGAPKYDLGYNAPEKAMYSAHMLINTISDEANQPVIDALSKFCEEHYFDLTAKVRKLKSAGGNDNPIEVRLHGKDPKVLYAIADKVKAELALVPGAINISDDWGIKTKKFVIDIDATRSQMAGITNQDIAVSMQTAISGMETSEYREGDKSIPVVMTHAAEDNSDANIEELESFNIYSQASGKNVPLKQVADIRSEWQYTRIKRRDLFRTLTVTAGIDTETTANEVLVGIDAWLKKNKDIFPAAYSYSYGGEKEDSAKGLGSVQIYLPLSFFLIILLLVAQFNSLKKPLIILLTIPLGMIGVVYGLLLAKSYMGFFAILGLISLAGIVINNGIVLLDRIQVEQDENNRPAWEAIIAAAKERFRPILLTTTTTVCGLVPLWLGGGIMFEPMAVGILFGLIFATVLTLVFVPVLYKLIFRVAEI